MDKYEKEIIKEEKLKQKLIMKTRKKAGIPKNATYEETNALIIKYAATMNKDFDKLHLSDEQKKDPEFLLKLYNANIEFAWWQRPNEYNKDLTSNVEFMAEFIKFAVKREISLRRGCKTITNEDYEKELTYLIRNYRFLFDKPEFFEKISEEYPMANIVKVIEGCVKNYHILYSFNRMIKIEEDYENLIMSLSKETLVKNVKKFGLKVLKELPKELPYFAELVDICITKEGFKALKELPVEQVLENKDLVIKAYSVDGIKALSYYIISDLSPNRTHSYMCHGDDHYYIIYHKEYAIAQNGLLEDETIKTLFKISKKALSETSDRNVKITLDAFNLLDGENLSSQTSELVEEK